MTTATRRRALVEYVVLHNGDPLGIVTANGYDAPAAEDAAAVMASTRWRFSRAQLTVTPWDDCPPDLRAKAALAERNHWDARHRTTLQTVTRV